MTSVLIKNYYQGINSIKNWLKLSLLIKERESRQINRIKL